MARMNGVAPFIVTASMLAPFSTKYSITSYMPEWHAKCRGVHRKLSSDWRLALKHENIALRLVLKYENTKKNRN